MVVPQVHSRLFFALSVVLSVAMLLEDTEAGLLCPTLRFDNGRVRIRSKGRIAKFNCFRQFQLVGDKYLTCLRGRWEGVFPVCVRSGCPPVDGLNNGQVLDTNRGAVLTFFCNPGYSLEGSRTMYCNGKTWNGTTSSCVVRDTDPALSCDFEDEDLCGWVQDPTHSFDWKRQNFVTPSGHVGTGPSFDHTLGEGYDGHYMYIESSSPRLENDTARLFSPVYRGDLSQDACFVFWYHMYGATMGVLNVYVKPEGTRFTDLDPMFSKARDQGNEWYEGYVTLEEMEEPFQIIVEAVRGPSYVSDTAIDDVKLAHGEECLQPTTAATSGDVVDSRSCRDRCGFTSETTSDDEVPIVLCDCDADCVDNRTCCLDYYDMCVIGRESTPAVSMMTSSSSTLGGVLASRETETTPRPVPPGSSPFLSTAREMTPSSIPIFSLPILTSVPSRYSSVPSFGTSPAMPTTFLPGSSHLTANTSRPTLVTTESTPKPHISTLSILSTRITTPWTTAKHTVLSGTTQTEPKISTSSTSSIYSSRSLPKTLPSSTLTAQVTARTEPTMSQMTLPAIPPEGSTTDEPRWANTAPQPRQPPTNSPHDEQDNSLDSIGVTARAVRSKKESGIPLVAITGISSGLGLLMLAALVAACALVRRRQKEKEQRGIAEDSDVRYLTAEEQLDFTLAKPPIGDDEL